MESPSVSAIDFKDALDRVDGDVELYFELVDGFVAEFDVYRNRLESATKTKNTKEMKDIAHTVKGVLGNLSAARGYQIASKMDLSCNLGKFDEVAPLLPGLFAAVEEFFTEAEKLKTEHLRKS